MDVQIVCQGSLDDDSSTGNGDQDNDLPGEEQGGHVAEDEMGPDNADYFDGFSRPYNGRKREQGGRRAHYVNSVHGNGSEGDRTAPFPPEAPVQYRPGPRGLATVYPSENIGKSREERYAIAF